MQDEGNYTMPGMDLDQFDGNTKSRDLRLRDKLTAKYDQPQTAAMTEEDKFWQMKEHHAQMKFGNV